MDETLLKERKDRLEALMRDPAYVPMKTKELAMLLGVPKQQRGELQEVLDALVQEGRAGVSKRGKYARPETFSVTGIFSGNSRGFGFVTVDGMEQDVFIPAEKTGGALHGDKVLLTLEPGRQGKRAEGAVIRVLEHANEQVIGYYQKNKHFGFVIPDNSRISRDIFIPEGKDMGAVTGHKVVAKLTDFGGRDQKPEGVITEILGHVNDPGTDILSVIRAYGLPEAFPDEVMEQVSRIPAYVTEEEKTARLDLRDLPTVTIDGEDAKDLDDAITVSRTESGYLLGVHIADVSHYVRENSPLDQEALRRGTSVYLVDRVIPMLPHKLSNGICSLNAGEDRLALSCLMELDAYGEVTGHRIAETLIRVDERMTYTAVNRIVTDHDHDISARYENLVPMFELMKEVSALLRERRQKRGSIDFDFPESKIILDEKGWPVDIRPYERNTATRIIEDFMLLANETVAEDYFWQELPFLYRTHENPDPDKMKALGLFINNFGYSIRTQNGQVHPKEIQKLLDRISGTPQEGLIGRLTLRSMKKAGYTPVNTGHFGLAAKYYTHFTSPIRRYPDLQIHRIMKENMKSGLSERRLNHYESILPGVAAQCSALERRADEAERETQKLKKCQYMSRHIGEEFDGVVSGVTAWGLYVELPNTVEGMIHVNALEGDYFVFREDRMELAGELTGRTYKLGQRLRIQVLGTDMLTRTIDFIPARTFGGA